MKPSEALWKPTREWPQPLSEDALIGLAGEIVGTIEPHTESDPAAILTQYLIAFGNAVNGAPFFMQERTRHTAREFVVIVGQTAKARKGTSWDNVKALLEIADSGWSKNCRASGLASGEGVVFRIRDQEADGSPVQTDKRLLVVESELASVLNVAGREGNTLSEIIRNAWDSGDLQILRANNPIRASGGHVSIIGHITTEELRLRLSGNDVTNGFANRFLFVCAKRTRLLPEGGNLLDQELHRLGAKVAHALDEARKVSRMVRSPEARELWIKDYPELSRDRPGRFGNVTTRAEAHVLRLSIIYALLDGSPTIEIHHLRAALEVWRYCEESARFIFGDDLQDEAAERIRQWLMEAGDRGMSRTEISQAFSNNRKSEEIQAALDKLTACNLARCEKACQAGGKRPVETWFAVQKLATNRTNSTKYPVALAANYG